MFHGRSAGHPGWNGASPQLQQEPLRAPPGPLQYRVLSTIIADQLQSIARAEIKRLGEAFCGEWHSPMQPISTASSLFGVTTAELCVDFCPGGELRPKPHSRLRKGCGGTTAPCHPSLSPPTSVPYAPPSQPLCSLRNTVPPPASSPLDCVYIPCLVYSLFPMHNGVCQRCRPASGRGESGVFPQPIRAERGGQSWSKVVAGALPRRPGGLRGQPHAPAHQARRDG